MSTECKTWTFQQLVKKSSSLKKQLKTENKRPHPEVKFSRSRHIFTDIHINYSFKLLLFKFSKNVTEIFKSIRCL